MQDDLEKLERLLAGRKRVHMFGIGGVGMASLAIILHQRGFKVSGCDLQLNSWTRELSELGIPVFEGHDVEYHKEADWCIRSTAVPLDHPVLTNAREAKLSIYQRGIVLAYLMRENYTIAVAGSHGKTTTAALLAQLLSSGYVIGGSYQGDYPLARDDRCMVVEVDESDGTLIHVEPDQLIVTNIDYDHLEHHGSADQFLDTFRRLVAQTREQFYFDQQDPLSDDLCGGDLKAIPIPWDERALCYAHPSAYNQKNVSAALAVADRVLGRSIKTSEVARLPKIKRRHELLFEQGGMSIITDYAHHPTEIKALIKAAQNNKAYTRIIVIFQPHRYTRTHAMKQEMANAFKGVDALCITPVYAASEKPIEGGLAKDVLACAQEVEGLEVSLSEDLIAAWKWGREQMQPGVQLLLVGAGDIDNLRLEVDDWISNHYCN